MLLSVNMIHASQLDFIKTKSGRILVHNCCFLRHRTPASLQPPSPSQNSSAAHHTSLPVQPSPLSQAQDKVRCSTHTRRPPVEDPTWPKWCQGQIQDLVRGVVNLHSGIRMARLDCTNFPIFPSEDQKKVSTYCYSHYRPSPERSLYTPLLYHRC